MKSKLSLLTLAAALMVSSLAAAPNKVAICHVPPGNPENAQDIEISQNAVAAHLAHGDFEGPCALAAPTSNSLFTFGALAAGLAGIGLLRRRTQSA